MKTKCLGWVLWIPFQISAVSVRGFDSPLTPVAWLLVMGITSFATIAHATLTTNKWIVAPDSGSKWEFASSWDHGVPSPNYSVHVLTPPTTLNTLATADVATVASNVIDNCLTISNLMVGSSGGVITPTATLSLSNMNATAGNGSLFIENTLTINSHGVVTITNSVLRVSSNLVDDGLLILNTGTLVTTNGPFDDPVEIGDTGAGRMTMLDGTWYAYNIIVGNNPGSQGTLTLNGGTISISAFDGSLDAGEQPGATGTVWMSGGQITAFINIGAGGVGQMIVSNGTWLSNLDIGAGGLGTLTIAGNANDLGGLGVGGYPPGTGAVWMTGGHLIGYATIGFSGVGQMTISNGVWDAGSTLVGYSPTGQGTLTMSGGQINATNSPFLVAYAGASGNLKVTAGSLLAGEVDVGVGTTSVGRVTMLGGVAMIGSLNLGYYDVTGIFGSGNGYLTVASGSLNVFSNLSVGVCATNAFGIATMTGGALYVTNAAHNAVLDISNGTFLQEGGTLFVDRLVVTNSCVGFFDRIAGTLTYATLVMDPDDDTDGDGLPNWWEQQYGLDPLSSSGDNGPEGDPDGDGYSNLEEYLAGSDPRNPLSTPLQIVAPPFQITSILRSNNNIILTWTTSGGSTNQVQVTGGAANGTYSTNGFTNLGAQMLIGGVGIVTTNYTDIGGATNKPARYYRVRFVP